MSVKSDLPDKHCGTPVLRTLSAGADVRPGVHQDGQPRLPGADRDPRPAGRAVRRPQPGRHHVALQTLEDLEMGLNPLLKSLNRIWCTLRPMLTHALLFL